MLIKYCIKQLILQKNFQNRSFEFSSISKNSKLFFLINFLISIFLFEIVNADTNNFISTKNNQMNIEYLDSRNELEDYIIDTGDSIYIEFLPTSELTGTFPVNEEGELILPRIYDIYVRGLTISELEKLLETKYAEFLIDPKFKVRIALFRRIRVSISGEVRFPGIYNFPAYISGSFLSLENNADLYSSTSENNVVNPNLQLIGKNLQKYGDLSGSNNLSNDLSNDNTTTIAEVIRKAGGITSKTDLSRIEVTRNIPLGKGGGKKKASINFNSYLNGLDPNKDIRLFDGDSLFIPRLSNSNPSQIPKSIFSGISPKFISVNIFGRVANPGVVKLPLDSSLSDIIDLTGPIQPLSGKIILIRYNLDGTIQKKNISYFGRAKRGSRNNPLLRDGDLISVKSSIFGKTTGYIKEFTAPFVGIYSAIELYEKFGD